MNRVKLNKVSVIWEKGQPVTYVITMSVTVAVTKLNCRTLCVLVPVSHFSSQLSSVFMSSLCGVGVRVRVRVNNFSSKTTRPRDVLFFLKDTLSIEDEKLFKACKSVCSSVC